MLVHRLERRRPAGPEDRCQPIAIHRYPRRLACPVVGQFVIVHGDQPRERGVRAAQGGVGFVPGVVHSIAGEVARFVAQPGFDRGARASAGYRIFVEVVAEVHDQIQVFHGHMAVGRVVPVIPGLAGGERETQPVNRRPGRGRGPGAADRGDRRPGPEPVEVPAGRFEAADLRMHRMSQGTVGDDGTAVYDPPEPVVVGDFVVDGHRRVVHPTRPVRGTGVGGQPCPQDHPLRGGIPGGDPQRERITQQPGRPEPRAARRRRSGEQKGRRGAPGEEPPACGVHVLWIPHPTDHPVAFG